MERTIGVDSYNLCVTGQVGRTLSTPGGGLNEHIPCVMEPIVLESNQNHATVTDTGICSTLPEAMGKGGGYVPMVVEPTVVRDEMTIKVDESGKAFSLRGRDFKGQQAIVYTQNADNVYAVGNGQLAQAKLSNKVGSLNCMHDQQILLIENEMMDKDFIGLENHPADSRVKIDESGKVQTLSGRMGTGGNNTLMVMAAFRKGSHPRTADEAQGYEETEVSDTLNIFDNTEMRTPTLGVEGNGDMEKEYAVRRLTPLECERLQGFPDGWTDIGEWTDSKGKKRDTTDSARYKALGNSICLPPWKWVLKRISAMYERDATMASLFDGIAGFPFLWQQLNGYGTCLWASEIEEFCIAVTEKRINGKDVIDLRNTD